MGAGRRREATAARSSRVGVGGGAIGVTLVWVVFLVRLALGVAIALARYADPCNRCVILAERLVQPTDGVPVHTVHEVRVGVHHLCGGGVPQQRLYDRRVLTPREESCGEGVTETVEGEALCLREAEKICRSLVEGVRVVQCALPRRRPRVGRGDQHRCVHPFISPKVTGPRLKPSAIQARAYSSRYHNRSALSVILCYIVLLCS